MDYFGDLKDRFIRTKVKRNGENSSKLCFVLKESEERAFVIDLHIYDKIEISNLRISKFTYPFLGSDRLFTDLVGYVNKEDILEVSEEKISSFDYYKLIDVLAFVLDFNKKSSEKRSIIEDIISEYNKEIIKDGAVLTVKESKDVYKAYYVLSKSEIGFIGIKLNYDCKKGLSVTNETVFVPYTKYVDCNVYLRDFSDRIINEYNKLTLK